MSTILRRYSGPGVLALVGLGFDLGTFTGSSMAAYAVWGVALLWAIYASLPWLRRLRLRSPFTVVPQQGLEDDGRLEQANESLRADKKALEKELASRGDAGKSWAATVTQGDSSAVIRGLKAENERLKAENDELKDREKLATTA